MANLITSRPRNETVRRKVTSTPTTVSFTGTAARSTALSRGDYYVKPTQDCYILQGGTTVTATTSCWIVAANEELVITVEENGADEYISALRVSVSGDLLIQDSEAVI